MAHTLKVKQAFQSAQATVSNTALTLVTFGFTAAEVARATQVDIYVNTNGIRYDNAGNAPTVAQGIRLLATDEQPVSITGKNEINNLQLIRDDATDAEVYIVLKS